ncbi:hypothetical protein HAX54_022827, partial [Datura stramonium]|nr:hypothetical protein [Datura stramonium]
MTSAISTLDEIQPEYADLHDISRFIILRDQCDLLLPGAMDLMRHIGIIGENLLVLQLG